ncbi:MAG: hypothetical protein J2P36_19295 [Ktedonobacteraceae bacterium]|nr:hypothetical protein [Ktedonobacteraceae bacterium]
MTTSDNKALYDDLVAEYNHHFDYWDWSHLAGRRVEIPAESPAWNYTEIVQAAMQQAHSVLDMRTGSGELFLKMLQQSPVPEIYATESYAPNLARACQLLTPLGALVYETLDEHLPFTNNALELIINRHGSYDPHEVLRVLKPGRLFITQQVGDQTNKRIHELLGSEKRLPPQKPAWNLDYAVREMHEAGWHIIEQKEQFSITRFYDAGAIVYYLKAIPWEVPDFSVGKYFDKLVEIHELIQRESYVDVPFHTFFITARQE